MAFQPTITACLKNNCKVLQVTDSTDIYNATSNPKGWEDASTLLGANVSTAYLYITYPDDITYSQTVDVTSQIATVVTGTFVFNDIFPTGTSFDDGYYEILYEITDTSSNVYSYKLKVYFSCNARCCINKMWNEYASKLCGDCGCEAKDLRDHALEAEAFYDALNSCASCLNTTTRDNILTMINRLCDSNDCNCD